MLMFFLLFSDMRHLANCNANSIAFGIRRTRGTSPEDKISNLIEELGVACRSTLGLPLGGLAYRKTCNDDLANFRR